MIALSGAAALLSVTLAAQQAPPPQPAPPAGAPPAQGQPGGGGGRGFGRAGAPPEAYDNYTGFTKLWDGATFTNWNGESDVWSIEDGMLHADTTKTPGQHHIYYTGPGAVMRDFDLKVEVKLSAMGANGGVQYAAGCCTRRTADRFRIRSASRCRRTSRRFNRRLTRGLRPRRRRVAADPEGRVAAVATHRPAGTRRARAAMRAAADEAARTRQPGRRSIRASPRRGAAVRTDRRTSRTRGR